jgi:hypothetical protein
MLDKILSFFLKKFGTKGAHHLVRPAPTTTKLPFEQRLKQRRKK